MVNITQLYDKFCTRARNGLIRIPFMEKWSVPDWLVGVCVYSWFVMVVIWFIANCFFGLGTFNDECYMALCCRDYAEQPMAMLTFFGGWLAIHLFGDQIITLRLLMCFSLFIGIGVPCWYCYRRTGSLRWGLFTASCVLVYVLSSQYKFYGWDYGPIMYAGPLITLIVSLYDRITVTKVIGVGSFAALTILARVPAAIIVVPLCFISLWFATKGIPRRGYSYWRYAGIGFLSFIAVALICVTVMKGSPAAYIESWRSENIITGHGLREAYNLYYGIAKYDVNLIICMAWVEKYALASIVVLLFFSRRSRFLPALILLSYLFYRKLMIPNCMNVPRATFDLMIILFPFIYNLKSKLLGERSRIEVDFRKFWTIIAFVLVMAVGSDRILLRINYYYMLPLLLVALYPVRRGIIFWAMLFIIMPNFIFAVDERMKEISCYRPMKDVLPYHNYIYDEKNAAVNFFPLRPVTDVMKQEGKRIVSFGEGRYTPSYLYEDGKPYRINAFHLYYMDEMARRLDDFLSCHDCAVVRNWGGMIYTREDMRRMMRERDFYITAVVGEYVVFERIEPLRFQSVTDAEK